MCRKNKRLMYFSFGQAWFLVRTFGVALRICVAENQLSCTRYFLTHLSN